jgi:RimJ/RimL family protein N-acetyltransferase
MSSNAGYLSVKGARDHSRRWVIWAWENAEMDRPEIRLRPFGEPDLVLCDRSVNDPDFAGPFEWNGFGVTEDYRNRWQEDRLLGASPYHLVVALTEDDTAVGWVNWQDTARAGPGVWEIGVLITPEMRGRGVGSTAQSRLVDYLFATTPAHRIWAGTEVENIAEQGALERCGFRQEGLLRGHHFRDGQWRDSYIYGLIRSDNADRPRP